MSDQKAPSKPKPTTATPAELVGHYHSQLDAYNATVRSNIEEKRQAELLMEPIDNPDSIPKEGLVELIRRQNHRLGRHIKARSHELLLVKVADPSDPSKPLLNKNGHTVGLTYRSILDTLAIEFPEASTSAACLRWYVVHMRSDAADQGLEWPPLPQMRPRSSVSAAASSAAAEGEV